MRHFREQKATGVMKMGVYGAEKIKNPGFNPWQRLCYSILSFAHGIVLFAENQIVNIAAKRLVYHYSASSLFNFILSLHSRCRNVNDANAKDSGLRARAVVSSVSMPHSRRAIRKSM
jgi:hypothetical protein